MVYIESAYFISREVALLKKVTHMRFVNTVKVYFQSNEKYNVYVFYFAQLETKSNFLLNILNK